MLLNLPFGWLVKNLPRSLLHSRWPTASSPLVLLLFAVAMHLATRYA